jgi:ABC-type branched-subunit amino acid transport system ATPase component
LRQLVDFEVVAPEAPEYRVMVRPRQKYGTSQILFGVGLSVRQQGETMALLGRNGAGKSTTMKAIMGLAPARRGKVTLRAGSCPG